jgi:PAS domain S-box-containing protein
MSPFVLPLLASPRPPATLRYGVALGTLTMALVFSLLLHSLITPVPFILFFAAVAVNAWYGGLRIGLLTACIALLLTNYFLIEPYYALAFELGDLLRSAVFLFVAGLISWLSEARRSAEARAYAQAERFYVTLASIGDAVVATDAHGRVTFLNTVAEQLTGWSLVDAAGKQITDVFHIVNADTRQVVESPVARVLREGTIVGLANHTLLIARDGTERPIDDSGAPIKDRTGELIGVVLVFRDVTERVASEAALQASRDQLEVILGGVADGIVAEAPGGSLVYANDVAAQAIGYPSVQAMLDAAPSERLGQFSIMDEAGDILPPAQLPSRLVLAGADHAARVLRYRTLATGQERWAQVQARPVRDARGQVVLAIALMHDITMQRLAEAERDRLLAREQAARAEAEAAVRLRDQFLSVAAHELRTPLTSLMGQAQLFQRRAVRERQLNERDQRTLQIINQQVSRLNKMVSALLDVSRLELGQLSIEHAPVDICALVRRVVAEVRPTVEDRTIHLDCPVEPIVVWGDELRLEQVVQNLIQNALKYSQPPEPVSVGLTSEAGRVCVAVRDRGMGIPAEALPHLFQRFYRADNVEERQISGMGIGLYVVREIVTLHDGEITVESVEGVGSTFMVCLPQDGSGDELGIENREPRIENQGSRIEDRG